MYKHIVCLPVTECVCACDRMFPDKYASVGRFILKLFILKFNYLSFHLSRGRLRKFSDENDYE